MKLYTAGPMTGIPQFNYPLFDSYAASLRAAGHEVTSPAELDDPETRRLAMLSTDGSMQTDMHGHTWGDFLARDVKLLADGGVEGVVVMPDWQRSRGARLETFVANAMCGLPVFTWNAAYCELAPVRPLDLFRAWCKEPDLAVASESYRDGYLAGRTLEANMDKQSSGNESFWEAQ